MNQRCGRGLTALFAVAVLCCGSYAQAQQSRITDTVKRSYFGDPGGPEYWFGILRNGDDDTEKYFQLLVGAYGLTNIYVRIGDPEGNQKVIVKPHQPNTIDTIDIPVEWEMKTSGIPEQKLIHVWSTNTDLTCALVSHNINSTDATNLLPLQAWGTNYVVASYSGLATNSAITDHPSEFLIVARNDSTITPTADIRMESAPHTGCDSIIHRKGVPFTQQLLRYGDVVQFIAACSTGDTTLSDFTGTIIHSDQIIGVIAGSECANIPGDYPTCSHICEMIPAVWTWSNRYYSVPFYPANPGKLGNSFLVIGTEPNQFIHRFDSTHGDSIVCTLANPFDHNCWHDIDQASRWTSDAPFLLVQYMNSPSYPDGKSGNGAPSEMLVSPTEQYNREVTFQFPSGMGGVGQFVNYANLISKVSARTSTKLDGTSITALHHTPIDSVYEATIISGLTGGVHTVTSDQGVGVNLYGYGEGEAYSMQTGLNSYAFSPNDTIGPLVAISHAGYTAHVDVVDTESLFSHMIQPYIRSIENMTFAPDPNWTTGSELRTTYYDLAVIDTNRPAVLEVWVYGFKWGQETEIKSIYMPTTPYTGGVREQSPSPISSGSAPNIIYEGENVFRIPAHDDWSDSVTLVVSDLLGKPVLTTSFDAKSPFDFDLYHVPGGVYFYRITNHGASSTGKILVTK